LAALDSFRIAGCSFVLIFLADSRRSLLISRALEATKSGLPDALVGVAVPLAGWLTERTSDAFSERQ
jgi:hypothetical protein